MCVREGGVGRYREGGKVSAHLSFLASFESPFWEEKKRDKHNKQAA